MDINAYGSLLGAAFRLQGGSSAVSGLLGPTARDDFSSQDLLSGALSSNAFVEGSEGNSALVDFVKEFVPGNESLLRDIAAVTALGSLTRNDTPSSAQFLNPYTQILAGGGESAGSIVSALL